MKKIKDIITLTFLIGLLYCSFSFYAPAKPAIKAQSTEIGEPLSVKIKKAENRHTLDRLALKVVIAEIEK